MSKSGSLDNEKALSPVLTGLDLKTARWSNDERRKLTACARFWKRAVFEPESALEAAGSCRQVIGLIRQAVLITHTCNVY